jgi:hypothetical protein
MDDLDAYLAEKKVRELFQELMEAICREQPDNVPAFIVNYLRENYADEVNAP